MRVEAKIEIKGGRSKCVLLAFLRNRDKTVLSSRLNGANYRGHLTHDLSWKKEESLADKGTEMLVAVLEGSHDQVEDWLHKELGHPYDVNPKLDLIHESLEKGEGGFSLTFIHVMSSWPSYVTTPFEGSLDIRFPQTEDLSGIAARLKKERVVQCRQRKPY